MHIVVDTYQLLHQSLICVPTYCKWCWVKGLPSITVYKSISMLRFTQINYSFTECRHHSHETNMLQYTTFIINDVHAYRCRHTSTPTSIIVSLHIVNDVGSRACHTSHNVALHPYTTIHIHWLQFHWVRCIETSHNAPAPAVVVLWCAWSCCVHA